MLKIYLARSISGCTPDEVFEYYDEAAKRWQDVGYKVLSPMLGKEHLRTELQFREHSYKHPISTNHAIFERDKWMVSQADVVYVNLLDTKRVSIGCMMELAWASLLGKHTVVVMEKENEHRHAFVLEAADILFETEEEAEQYLEKLVTAGFSYI